MRIKIVIPLALFIACIAAASVIVAAPDDPAQFSLAWWTVDGGGGTSSAGTYVLSGTIGQPDVHCASGGSYLLTGGFWNGTVIHFHCHRVYLPVILK